jgi:hypothetical protein
MGDVLDYAPFAAAAFAIPQFQPQVLKVRGTSDTAGVSWAWAALTCVNNAAWIAYFAMWGFWTALVPASSASAGRTRRRRNQMPRYFAAAAQRSSSATAGRLLAHPFGFREIEAKEIAAVAVGHANILTSVRIYGRGQPRRPCAAISRVTG